MINPILIEHALNWQDFIATYHNNWDDISRALMLDHFSVFDFETIKFLDMFKDHINWQQFTKTLYNLYNLHMDYSIAKYALIKRFKDYLDWNFLRKQQLYINEYYGFYGFEK